LPSGLGNGTTVTKLPAWRERLRWLSLTPFDQSTAAGRAQERHRRMALTAAASALAKLLSVGSALISVPLTLHYLGAERFGLWMTISALIAMLAFADFGIANGVLSMVADAHGRDDRAGIRRAVASGFYLLTGIALVVLILFAALYAFVSWPAVFNVNSRQAVAEAGPALAVFVMCFAANIPLAVVQRVQLGLQQGFVASLWQCVGSVCGLVGVLWAVYAKAGLPWLVLALAGAPLLAAVLNSVYFFLRARPDLLPRWSAVSRQTCRQVASSGALFFVLQLVVAVAYTSDSIVVAQLLGAPAVATYAVPEKLFSLVSLCLGMVLAPLWPAYGEAIARGDTAWVRRTLKRTLWFSFGLSSAASLLLLWLGPALLGLWVDNLVIPPLQLMLALAVWKVVEAVSGALAMFLNGARVIALQVLVASSTAVLALGLKLALVPHLGIAGAVWATVVAYLLFALIPYAVLIPKLKVLRASSEKA
jgi:O-antigen/teichoic acid export membrane protein